MSQVSNITPDHILWPDGCDNMGGTQTIAYWAPLTAFTINGIPELVANPTSLEEAAVLPAGNFAFNAGQGFRKCYLTEDTGSVTDESVGERDGKSFKNKFKMFHPGTRAQSLGWARYLNNTGVIFVVVEADDQKRVVGSRQFPAKVDTNTITTTETTDGRKGMTMEVSAASKATAAIYEGDIELFDDTSGSGS